MKKTAGGLFKLTGDLAMLASIFFAASIAFIRFTSIVMPRELEFLAEASDVLERELGPAWWALVLALGAIAGWSLSGVGRRMAGQQPEHWDRRY